MRIAPYILLHKERGETPLQAIDRWRSTHIAYASVPATYAGRLDPMADGVLLVLLGEECKRKDTYIGLDKEYIVSFVLDISTDTLDILGIPQHTQSTTAPSMADLAHASTKQLGTHHVPYPAFSSKPVNGMPLFTYALAGTLNTVDIPVHQETVYAIRDISQEQVFGTELYARIQQDLVRVPRSEDLRKAAGADFRQDAIRSAWHDLFLKQEIVDRTYCVVTMRVTCGSGAYMRTLVSRIAAELGTTACALSITRTRIGTYVPVGRFGFWSTRYT